MEAVYRHYLPLVELVAGRGFGGFGGFYDPVLRDDAIQAIFVTAFEDKARLAYDGVGDYTRFLRGLAQNVCRQLLDKDRRFARVPDPEALTPDPPLDLEARYLADEAMDLCRRFRDGLADPLERQVLDGYFAHGDSEETLAQALGVTRYRLRKVIAEVAKKMARFQKEHGLP